MSLAYAAVIALAIAAWVVPMAAALAGRRPKRFQYCFRLVFIVLTMTCLLLAVGPEYASGFLLLGFSVGGVLTWAVMLDSP